SGVMAGGVFIFKQNVGVFALLAVIGSAAASANAGLARGRKGYFTRTGLAALGFIIVAGAAFGLLAARHALMPMLAHFVHHASVYAEAKGIALPPPRMLLPFIVTAVALAAAGILIARMAPRVLHLYVAAALVLLIAVVVMGDSGPGSGLLRSIIA